MGPHFRFSSRLVTVVAAMLGLSPAAQAAVLHESASLGPTGFVHFQSGSGLGLYIDAYVGSEFHLNEPVVVDAIGGHLNGGGTLFGAIVSLPTFRSLPETPPFGDTLRASVVFTPPSVSKDVRVPLSVSLPAGDYAVIFGSGLFGAYGSGGMFYNGTPMPGQAPCFWLPSQGWRFSNSTSQVARFVVTGTIVPEPSPVAAVLGITASVATLSRRRALSHVGRDSSRQEPRAVKPAG